jgi:type IV pilus assembly protein PilC
MPCFFYKIHLRDKIISGSVYADNIDLAKYSITKKGGELLSIKKQIFDFQSIKLKNAELISFFTSISAMDKVGIDILKALELMKNEIAVTKNLKEVSTRIYSYVSGGDSFSDACRRASRSFTDDFIGLISIAEKTGKFSSVFEEMVEYIKWSYDINSRSKKAIRGPLFTLLFMVSNVVIMSILALPKIMDFLQYFNMEPPATTIALIAFSTFLKKYWIVLVILFIATPSVLSLIGKFSSSVDVTKDRMKLFIPIFGSLLLKIDTSRFIAFFSLMYNSGAEMLDIIQGVSKVVKNKYIASRVMNIYNKVLAGSTVFKAIDDEKLFPVMFRKMMAICEATGEVGPVLENVRYFYDKEAKDTVEKIIGTIKPILTVILGVMLVWIGSAMLGPIYSNIGSMGETTNSARNSAKGGE